jgi:hypothetical protein
MIVEVSLLASPQLALPREGHTRHKSSVVMRISRFDTMGATFLTQRTQMNGCLNTSFVMDKLGVSDTAM